jgi:hypothetical protein
MEVSMAAAPLAERTSAGRRRPRTRRPAAYRRRLRCASADWRRSPSWARLGRSCTRTARALRNRPRRCNASPRVSTCVRRAGTRGRCTVVSIRYCGAPRPSCPAGWRSAEAAAPRGSPAPDRGAAAGPSQASREAARGAARPAGRAGPTPNPQMQPTGRPGPASARARGPGAGQWSKGLCGRQHEGLQLICIR